VFGRDRFEAIAAFSQGKDFGGGMKTMIFRNVAAVPQPIYLPSVFNRQAVMMPLTLRAGESFATSEETDLGTLGGLVERNILIEEVEDE
jgi:hypothetical protein